MTSKLIIEAVIKQAKTEYKDVLLSMFITKLSDNYSYDDGKLNHCLELLLGAKPICLANINMDYIKEHFNEYVYKSEEYIIKDIHCEDIDNIECVVHISYKAKQKIHEDRDDIDFNQYCISINFIDNQKVLK